MGKTFWKLLEQSVLISGALAMMLVGVACYLWATGQEVPKELFALLGTVVGFFFGQRSERRIKDGLQSN